jgi:hypothetical protein
VPEVQDACKDGDFAGKCAHAVTRRIFRVTVNPQTTEASRRKLYDLLETFKGVCDELNRPFTEDPDDVSDDDETANAALGGGKKRVAVAADVGKGEDSVGKKKRPPPVDADEDADEDKVRIFLHWSLLLHVPFVTCFNMHNVQVCTINAGLIFPRPGGMEANQYRVQKR